MRWQYGQVIYSMPMAYVYGPEKGTNWYIIDRPRIPALTRYGHTELVIIANDANTVSSLTKSNAV